MSGASQSACHGVKSKVRRTEEKGKVQRLKVVWDNLRKAGKKQFKLKPDIYN